MYLLPSNFKHWKYVLFLFKNPMWKSLNNISLPIMCDLWYWVSLLSVPQSPYAILKVWQGEDQLEREQENQDRLLRRVIANHKAVTEEPVCTYNALGKMFHDCTDLGTSRLTLNKCDSFERSLKPNFCNREYARNTTHENWGCGRTPRAS